MGENVFTEEAVFVRTSAILLVGKAASAEGDEITPTTGEKVLGCC